MGKKLELNNDIIFTANRIFSRFSAISDNNFHHFCKLCLPKRLTFDIYTPF
ncbi:hypothetical protein HD_0602 [[Haemophilus] ducreyi 35000HP]|uniref:Uncharacterized protein n=1 Tax=Haemophilus ducreyi (strain 35000HP / ATCC 700724) TaxID=233412 RepID=Q7VNE7_HAEDU|nr:hypothetical protein HD_0602 [[Haemophilus] ducreyi 35000HP]